MSKLERIEIDRSIWRSGEDSEYSVGTGCTALLNDQGFMCCLGQIAKHYGYEDKQLLGIGEPYNLKEYKENTPLFTFDYRYGELRESSFCDRAIPINDSKELTQREKESELRKIAEKEGIKLVFKGKAVK